MKYHIAAVFALVLAVTIFTSPALALTDVYLAVDGAAAVDPDPLGDPILYHFTYDNDASPSPTYTIFGGETLGPGTTLQSLAVNSTQGPSGGIYAAMTGAFNQLAEYSFDHGAGTFNTERVVSGVHSEVAVDGQDRIYAVETATTGELRNYVPSGATFNTNASVGATDPGGNADIAIGTGDNVIVSGVTSGGAPSMTQEHMLSGSSFVLQSNNTNGALIPNDLVVSPIDGNLWYANNNIPLGSGFNSLYELVVPLTDDGGSFCCGFDSANQTIIFDDIDVMSDGKIVAVGASDFFSGTDEMYLLSFNPAGGAATALIQIGLIDNNVPEPAVLTVDENDIVHVSSGGYLVAWDLGPHPTLPGFDEFTARACWPVSCSPSEPGSTRFGDGTAIVTSVAPDPPLEDADFDGDGLVTGSDFLIWQRFFPTNGGASNPDGDANFDGNVLADDLAIWENQFGGPPPLSAAVAAVPEPASSLLALCGLLGIGSLRRRP